MSSRAMCSRIVESPIALYIEPYPGTETRMRKRTIAALAMEGGVGVETVRYYQRRGLLSEPKRPMVGGVARGVRTYGDTDVQRLHFVRRAQAAGFQLKEIKQLLAFQAADNRVAARE